MGNFQHLRNIYRSLSFRMIFWVGLIPALSISAWAYYNEGIILMAVFIFLGTSGFMAVFLLRFVNRPIRKLIEGTRHIGRGEYDYSVDLKRNDDIGHLATAINQMGKKIGEKQDELNKQKGEYQSLFESAPCYITVQDRDFRLLRQK